VKYQAVNINCLLFTFSSSVFPCFYWRELFIMKRNLCMSLIKYKYLYIICESIAQRKRSSRYYPSTQEINHLDVIIVVIVNLELHEIIFLLDRNFMDLRSPADNPPTRLPTLRDLVSRIKYANSHKDNATSPCSPVACAAVCGRLNCSNNIGPNIARRTDHTRTILLPGGE